MRTAAVLLVLVTACGGAHPATSHPPTTVAAAAGEHDDHGSDDGAHHGHHGHGDHRFVDAGEWAKVFDDPARDEWQRPDEVLDLLEVGPGLVVVDLGAGTGYFERRLSAKVGSAGRVLALDIEPTMVTYMEERGRREAWRSVEPRVIPADDPQLGVAQVDRILVVDTWHHLPDRAAYAQKLATALRAGGRLAVVDFTLDAPMGPPPESRLAAETVAAELNAAGLEATVAREGLPNQYVVVGVRTAR